MALTSPDIHVLNLRGEWVPAIPLPLFLAFGRVECGKCDERFRNKRRYQEHYAYVHILGMPA